MDVVIVEENLNCPKCIEQAKIIQRLRAQNTQLLAALSAAQNETASIPRSGDSSPTASIKRSKGGSSKKDLPQQSKGSAGLFPGSKKRRLSVSDKERPTWGGENDDIAIWPPEFLALWLDGKKLSQFKPIYFPDAPSSQGLDGPYTDLFCLDPQGVNTVYLAKASPSILVDLLLLNIEDPLHKIWPHPNFLRDFILTFQGFMKPKELWFRLTTAHDSERVSDLKTCTLIVAEMRTLLGDEFDDLDCPFPASPLKSSRSVLTPKKQSSGKNHVLPAGVTGVPTDLFSIAPRDLAIELTLWTEELTLSTKTTDFLNKQWERSAGAENLKSLVAHSNMISQWIYTAIISPHEAEQRAAAMAFFIHLAEALLELKNFHDLLNVVAALESAQIKKLKKSWSLVSSKDIQERDDLVELMGASDNYKKYSEKFSEIEVGTASIPLYTLTLHDLFMLEEKMETMEGGDVNWVKMGKVANHIWKLRSHRQVQFRDVFLPSSNIRIWLSHQPLWPDADIVYEIAVLRESLKFPLVTEDKTPRGQIPKLSIKDVESLKVGQTLISAPAGTVIIDIGDICKEPFFLLKGTITDPRRKKSLVGPSFFSTKFWLDEWVSSSQWVAVTKIEYYKIEKRYLEESCSVLPTLYSKINRMTAIRLAASSKKTKTTKSIIALTTSKCDAPLQSTLSRSLKQWKCSRKQNIGSANGIFEVHESDSTTFYTFTGANFGMKVKENIKPGDITNISSKKRELRLKIKGEESIFQFSKTNDTVEAFEFLNQNWKAELRVSQHNRCDGSGTSFTQESESEQGGSTFSWEPTEKEWDTILKGSREISYKKGETIISQGKARPAGLFQISSGTCDIRKTLGDQTVHLETISPGAIFGEISYILGTEASGASASIIACTDTTINFIEGYFLEQLFEYSPQIEGSFYGYLSKILAARIQLAEPESNKTP